MDYVLIDEEMLIETGGEKKVEVWQCTLPLPHDPFTHSNSCVGLFFGLHICQRAFCFSIFRHVPLGIKVHWNPNVRIYALGKRLIALNDTRTQEEKEKVKEQFLEMWAECVSQFQRPHFIIV